MSDHNNSYSDGITLSNNIIKVIPGEQKEHTNPDDEYIEYVKATF